ncbi:MAG: tetratricopeptide repeat protein [Xanthomonadaceae bacterium]|nr:tetratricopeptide repeat protein [Xanthomonadaceae bacterium]MDE1965521.1 tetratricopeptide repeat protein [Xanthomonadaceae bacterium]
MSATYPPHGRLSPLQLDKLAAAQRSLRDGDFTEAIRSAEAVATQAPLALDAWHLWAVALAQAGRHEEACHGPFRQALELAPDNVYVLANFATALRHIGRLDEAVGLWRRAGAINPAFGQIWLDLGMTELDRSRFHEAGEAFQQAIKIMPDQSQAWHGLASALDRQGHATQAEEALRKAVACEQSQPVAWIHLGNLLRRRAHLEEALKCYARARSIGDETPELLDAQAGALLDAGRIEDAIATARRLTALFPRFAPGQQTLASMLWEYGSVQTHGGDPLACFADAVRSHPDDARLRFTYAGMLKQTGRGEAALEQATRLRANGDHPRLVQLVADTLETLGRSQEAAPLYRSLYRDVRTHEPAFLNAYVRHLLKAGEWALAATVAQESCAKDPRDQEAWAYLGTAWRLLGDPREFWLCDYERHVALVDIEPPGGYRDIPQFLEALEKALTPLHRASREPVQQSLRGGTQTAGNLFGRPEPAITDVESAICHTTERWLGSLRIDPAHPFLGRGHLPVRVKGAWSVKLFSTGHHVNHIHQHGWISSAFYVRLPPAMDRAGSDAGSIQFGQPPKELGLDLPPRRTIRPREGSLAVFPSFMWHGTVPFHDDHYRLSIACDMVGA